MGGIKKYHRKTVSHLRTGFSARIIRQLQARRQRGGVLGALFS
jgi:hypothetical protein